MAVSQAEIIESLVEGFESRFGDSDDLTLAMAPGRVNLIGEYTDLNDGYVMPMTVDRGVYVAVRRRSDKRVRAASIRYDELIEYDLDQFTAPTPGSWSSYVLGVVEELRLRGHVDRGVELVVDGNLNLGAGLSSSAALEVATAVSLRQLFGFEMSDVEMVKLCQHVEHHYANVLCGIMDPFACAIGRRDHALFLDCRSLEYDSVPVVLGDYRIVIVNSEVIRSLASSAYNTRRAQCQEAVEYFRQHDPSVSALRDVSSEMFEACGDELSPVLRRRCHHVVTENQRVLDAVVALKAGELRVFGTLMSESHQSLRDDFEVSCPELDLLVKLALNTDGVLGSRMTGAGFGGCTVSLVHKDAVKTLEDRLNTDYTARFNLTPGIFMLEANLQAGPLSVS
jgi:galactokinase